METLGFSSRSVSLRPLRGSRAGKAVLGWGPGGCGGAPCSPDSLSPHLLAVNLGCASVARAAFRSSVQGPTQVLRVSVVAWGLGICILKRLCWSDGLGWEPL